MSSNTSLLSFMVTTVFLIVYFKYADNLKGSSGYGIVIGFFVAIILINLLFVQMTKSEKTITVKEKYIKPGKASTYRIIDTNNETYELSDSLVLMEFNSADDYANLQENKTYKIYYFSFRLPFISMFPKIYHFTPV